MSIQRDWKHFRDIIGGKLRKELKKFFSTGKFVVKRGKNGRMAISLPKINNPFIVYGESDNGVGRGPGKPGDVIKKDNKNKGDAGQEDGDGLIVSIDMDYLLQFMEDDLQLPRLKPKENETFEETKIKYINVSKTGPESLRHSRRTMKEAMKRLACSDQLEALHQVPGFSEPIKLITPIDRDRRYRQYKEIKIPSSNAVIMFGRDGSYSMDDYRCEIVSDMCWWIDIWVRRFFAKVERCYFWHDNAAKEVDEDTFYKYRYGGGTTCSTCPILMAEQFENRYPPNKWNIYCFYFSDGENWKEDNPVFAQTLKDKFPVEVCNLFALTQITCDDYDASIKNYLDDNIKTDNYRSVSIGKDDNSPMTPDERNQAIKKAIQVLLGNPAKSKYVFDS